MKTIYFLDRNVINLIKDFLEKKPIPNDRKDKLDMLQRLRRYDRKTSSISVIGSVMEGQKGRRESSNEVVETIDAETKAIASFFRKAKTDSDILKKGATQLSEAMNGGIEIYFDSYNHFLVECSQLIYQRVKPKKREFFLDKAIELSGKHGLQSSHPIVVLVVSTLYGCPHSRKILKPKQKKDNYYNEISDILTWLRLLGPLGNLIETYYKDKYSIKYLTLDASLNFFWESAKCKAKIEKILHGIVDYSLLCTYENKLFPDLSEEEYHAVQIKLGAVAVS